MDIEIYDLEPDPREVSSLNANDDIYLTITIGNAQIGVSKVFQDGELIAKGNLSEKTYLGNSANLNENTLKIETDILDVNTSTNTCVFTTTITNQDNEVLYTKTDKGDAPENGIAVFLGNYLFGVLLLFMMLAVPSQFAYAQGDNEVTFDELETPSSPGFILLDDAPASIERPTTPQGFGASLLGFFQGTGGAIETAPYWLANHPNLTAEDFYKKHNLTILQHLSFSAATVRSDSSQYVSGGIRTRLYQKYSDDGLMALDAKKQEIESLMLNIDFVRAAQLQGTEDPEELKELKKIENQLEELDGLRGEYQELLLKPVFTLDVAGAVGAGSMSKSYKDMSLSRWAIWVSLNYRPKGNDFYFTVLGRYLNNQEFEGYSDNSTLVDIGTRLNYDVKKFSASLEYLHRLDLDNSIFDDFRIAAIGSYQINDNFYLTSTFGKNFTDIENIIAMAGINFGFSQKKVNAF